MSGFLGGARRVAAIVAVGVTAVVSVTGLTATPASAAPAPPEQVLDRAARGEEAIRALGDRLAEVAALNDRTPAEFRADLRADDMLWVDPTGRLFFVDDFAGHDETHQDGAGGTDATVEGAMAPLADTFSLHSRPGSDRVVFLDFDGHDATGTAWDGAGPTAIAAPYDSDGDPNTFSDTERTTIQDVWARVAEDFAPFDVDVTTEDPGSDAIRRDSTGDTAYGTRLVVTPSKTYNCSCGGVAYVGVFNAVGNEHDRYQPAWVFTSGVGNGAKNIAEAASHEIGHNLGLSHDGGTGTGYYQGHGDWAPIMGVGYYRPITQWSKGEYKGATEPEDDFAEMGTHGAVLAADDHGDTAGTATTLGTAASGTIGNAGDVDAFSVTAGEAGTLTVAATPAASSPNLDIGLRVLAGDGTVLVAVDPPSSDSSGSDTSIGLGADVTLAVQPGTYTIMVEGVGFGDPRTNGYSDYGSLGRYTLAATVGGGSTEPPPDDEPPTDDPARPPSAPAGLTTTANGAGVTLSWTDSSDDETGFEVQREFQHKNGRWQGTTTLTADADATGLTDDSGTGTFRYRVRAVNAAGASDFTTWVVVDVTGSGGDTGGKGGGKGGGKPDKTR